MKSLLTASIASLALASTSALAFDDHGNHGDMKNTNQASQSSMSGQNNASAKNMRGVMVGGAKMSPKRTIVANASKADNLTTLVSAVKAADLVETLNGDGPFTVFAPTNSAFSSIQGTVDTLLQDGNQDQLKNVLTYHVVAADLSATDLKLLVSANGGNVMLDTVSGGTLTVTASGDTLMIEDESGNSATVETADVNQSNGVVHVVDTVLIPA